MTWVMTPGSEAIDQARRVHLGDASACLAVQARSGW
jgi:hypothetical protein